MIHFMLRYKDFIGSTGHRGSPGTHFGWQEHPIYFGNANESLNPFPIFFCHYILCVFVMLCIYMCVPFQLTFCRVSTGFSCTFLLFLVMLSVVALAFSRKSLYITQLSTDVSRLCFNLHNARSDFTECILACQFLFVLDFRNMCDLKGKHAGIAV